MAKSLPRIFDRYLLRRTRSLRAVTRCVISFWSRGEANTADEGVVFTDSVPHLSDTRPHRLTMAIIRDVSSFAAPLDHFADQAPLQIHYLEQTLDLPLIIFQALLSDQHAREFNVVHRLGHRCEGSQALPTLVAWGLVDSQKMCLPKDLLLQGVATDGRWLQMDYSGSYEQWQRLAPSLARWSCSVIQVEVRADGIQLRLLFDLAKDESQRIQCLLIQRRRPAETLGVHAA